MFLEGKIPIQVAIKLNMQEAEVTKLYSEFLNLNGLHALSEIYQEINGNIRYFLELYRLAIKANMNIQNIMAVLKIADNDFPTLEANYWTLHKTLSGLEAEKQRSTIVIMELKDQIWGLENTKDSLQSDCRELSLELTKLRLQEIRLKDTINNIQNGVLRSKIKEVVKSQVERFLSDRQLIFRLAFEPIIKSMRRDYTIIPNAYHTAINHPTPLLDRALNIEMMTGENNEINSDH
jgi:chromosome segregation ATPase